MESVRNRPVQVFPSVSALVEARKQVFAEYWNEWVEAVEVYDACQIGDGKFVNSWSALAYAKYLKHYFEYRFEEYYQLVKCPVLMLRGEDAAKDERHRAVMQGLSELVDSCQIVEVPGWIHPYGWILTPETGSEAVLAFLDEITE